MRKLEDTYRHKGLRKKLIDDLRKKGIEDEKVLDAMMQIPRHFFMDSAMDNIAYEDRAFPISDGQTISQPYTVAYQTQLLNVKPQDKILEIGTGSMYQATILAQMGAKVYSIERQKGLYEKTKKFIYAKQLPKLKFFYGDGFAGLPTYAPFDKVIVTAGAPFIPPKILDQMRAEGCMVIPLDEGAGQRMLRLTRHGDQSITEESFSAFSFVPMLGGKANRV